MFQVCSIVIQYLCRLYSIINYYEIIGLNIKLITTYHRTLKIIMYCNHKDIKMIHNTTSFKHLIFWHTFYLFTFKLYTGVYFICSVVLVSGVRQSDLVIYMSVCVCVYIYVCVCVCVCIYTHTHTYTRNFFFRLFSHTCYYRVLSRVPCAIQ